jgi:hypothetical protein
MQILWQHPTKTTKHSGTVEKETHYMNVVGKMDLWPWAWPFSCETGGKRKCGCCWETENATRGAY